MFLTVILLDKVCLNSKIVKMVELTLKAQAAADSLKQIFPDVEAEGVQLLIPMPGHAI